MEDKTKHLEFIQNTINRMANNSFLIKGWTVTFISLLFILAVNKSSEILLFLSLLPLICFWSLDAYYLRQEKLFRELYNLVIEDKVNKKFTMNTCLIKRGLVDSWFKLMFSHSIFILYSAIIFLNIILQLLIINKII